MRRGASCLSPRGSGPADALLMAVFPDTLLALVRGDLLALALLSRTHPDSLDRAADQSVRPRAGSTTDGLGRRFRRPEHHRLQFLAGLEHRHELGGHEHLRSTAGIAGPPGTALTHLECPEAANLEVLTLRQRTAKRVEQAVDDECRVILGHAGLPGNLLDQIGLRHRRSSWLQPHGSARRHAQSADPQGPGEAGVADVATENTDSWRATSVAWHRGHAVGTSPVRVCNQSKRSPHARQRYSYTGMVLLSIDGRNL